MVAFVNMMFFGHRTRLLAGRRRINEYVANNSFIWGFPRRYRDLANNYYGTLSLKGLYYPVNTDITADLMKFYNNNSEYSRAILSLKSISLIIREKSWFLRINIPLLLRFSMELDISVEVRENLISGIKENSAALSVNHMDDFRTLTERAMNNRTPISRDLFFCLGAPDVHNPIPYDGKSDIMYIPVIWNIQN